MTGNVRSFQQVSKVFIISSEAEKKPNPNVQPGWFSSVENDSGEPGKVMICFPPLSRSVT